MKWIVVKRSPPPSEQRDGSPQNPLRSIAADWNPCLLPRTAKCQGGSGLGTDARTQWGREEEAVSCRETYDVGSDLII